MVWWMDSWCLPRLPFELAASPKNGCFSPITEAWTVFTSRPNNFLHARQSYHHAATATETNRKRKASDDGLREAKARPPSQVACARRQAKVKYVQLAGCASRHRAMLELRPVRCAYPHAVRLLWPLPVGWVRGHRPHGQHQAAVLPAKLPAVLCNVQFHEGFRPPPCLPPSRASNRIVAHGRHIRITLL